MADIPHIPHSTHSTLLLVGPIPMLGVACGFAQTLLIADTSTVEVSECTAPTAIQERPLRVLFACAEGH